MKPMRIVFAVTAGWFVLSLGTIVYAALFVKPELPPHPAWVKVSPRDRAHAIAQPPDLPPVAHEGKDPELDALMYRYFPAQLSQHAEEVFIRDYFEDRKGGFLVDVGASHYKIRSTTHYLDVALGWHGIAIDAIAEFAPDYAKHRPRTKFFPVFVSDKSDDNVDFFVILNNSRLSTADKKTADENGEHETRAMKTVTLNALLDSQGVKQIDLLSMDIELWEPKALAGFDIDRFKPELVVIELHAEVRDQVLDYFAKHHYAQLEKYSKWDGGNAYFIPEADLAKWQARKQAEALAMAAPPAAPTAAPAATQAAVPAQLPGSTASAR